MRVLIVEDEALVALELEELLLDEGFEVVGSAANAAQAIDLGRRHRPDLALLDANLADGLTGPRIAKTLVHERLATVVFVTGQANLLPSDLHGAFGVIEKPCGGQAMVEALRFLSSYLCGKATKTAAPPVLRLASSTQQ
jgi:DNA-binding NarL/FixJ family response regulator